MHAIGANASTTKAISLGQVGKDISMGQVENGVHAKRLPQRKKCSVNFESQPQKGHRQNPQLKIGAALGGGGCLSVVSQLGFLRGFLVDTGDADDKDDLTITQMGSSSGGSWALAMFLNGQKNDSGVWYDHLRQNDHVFKDLHSNKWGQNALGRYCMVGILGDDEKDMDEWSESFTVCGSCASKMRKSYLKASCTYEDSSATFGMAQRCLSAADTLNNVVSAAATGDVIKFQKSGTALGDAMVSAVRIGLSSAQKGVEAYLKNMMTHLSNVASGKTQWYELPLDKGLINPILVG